MHATRSIAAAALIAFVMPTGIRCEDSGKQPAKPVNVSALPGLAPEPVKTAATNPAQPAAEAPTVGKKPLKKKVHPRRPKRLDPKARSRETKPRQAKAASPAEAAATRPAVHAQTEPPAKPSVPYQGPQWSFEPPADWSGPELPPGEMRYLAPGGDAYISVAFYEQGSPAYQDPPEFRRYMRRLGSIEDTRSLDTVKVSGRFASRVRYTTYHYPRTKLLGQAVNVFYAEMIMAPDRHGLYVVRYQAAKAAFQKHRPAYISFLATLKLPRTPEPPEAYYEQQDHIVQDLLEEKPSMDGTAGELK